MPLPQSSVKTTRTLLRDQAREAIRDAIVDGTLTPGEPLDDPSLQAWLGMSRTPIRDALLLLEADGLVTIAPQSVTRVADTTPEEFEESLQVIGGVVGTVLRVSYAGVDDTVRARLVDRVDATLAAVADRDVPAHMEAALGIYDELLGICTNATLVAIAHRSIVPFRFRYRVTHEARIPNWDLLADGWTRFRDGIRDDDVVEAQLAFEDVHRVPVPGRDWAPPVWDATAPSAD